MSITREMLEALANANTRAEAAESALSEARGLVREMLELADNWPGIAYTADLEARAQAALGGEAREGVGVAMSLDKRIDEYLAGGCPLARELAVLRTYCSCRTDDEAVDEAMAEYLRLKNPQSTNLFPSPEPRG